ncbi:MAG TPA: hypothetical protein VLX30_07460 [Burkholderiales bacterium]|nr:hypothetical protein [Burkholderiales bacterium]
MKKTDLEKLKGAQIAGRMKQAGAPARYGKDSALESRRERRRREQALGLVPFAVKLDAQLVERLHERARGRNAALDETVADLLREALGPAP